MTKKFSALLTAGLLAFAAVNASENRADTLAAEARHAFSFGFGTDLMSSYVSRGSYQAGPSLQPAMKASYAGFFLSAWGSVDFTGSQMRELDLAAGYRYKRFEVAVIDYYIAPHPEAEGRFFDFGHKSAHCLEASVSWTVSRRVPIGLWWGTMFAGADIGGDGRRNYSSYAEISYPFTIRRAVDFKTGVGFMPWSTENCFNTRGFAVTNVYLHASRTWTLRSNIRLGVLARLICNPYREQVNFVGGITFHI